MLTIDGERTPGFKFFLVIVVALALTVPLFSVWLLVYDRQSQQQQATSSIAAGWGAAQTMSGPFLVIPYRSSATSTAVQNGQDVTRTNSLIRELVLAPEAAELKTKLVAQVRRRSIYEAVVYEARNVGEARFALPTDLLPGEVDPSQMDLTRAKLRFLISDPRGLGTSPLLSVNGKPLRLQAGGGASGGRGFFAWIDASGLTARPLGIKFAYDLRGSDSLSLAPVAGDMRWRVRSSWPSPSFAGDFLPAEREVGSAGFDANYRIGNLALGLSLVSTRDAEASETPVVNSPRDQPPYASTGSATASQAQTAQIGLAEPVDLYSQVNRATKYGFLFIGFTFLALLMFDVIGEVHVSMVEYLLMGAAVILFFVLLLAFAEVIGFAPAYVLASSAVAGLNTAYSAAVLESWRRAGSIGALISALYAVLYILLSLEDYSLLIGSLLLFATLAGVMYATRRIDWGAPRTTSAIA